MENQCVEEVVVMCSINSMIIISEFHDMIIAKIAPKTM